jgi:uncharacterized protein YbbC (DUF1343 family)
MITSDSLQKNEPDQLTNSPRAIALSLLLAVGSACAAPRVTAQDRPRTDRLVRRVRTGLEVLIADSIHLIRGKRVGLITNHTGVGPMGRSSVDLLFAAPGVKLTALFGPEHGIRGAARAGDKVASTVDSATGVPIYSLYGETRVPNDSMLKEVDVLIYDIQDVGARFYTYQWTMALSAEAAKRKFIVLDRPNPVRADVFDGAMLDLKYRSFIGWYPVSARYGLTVGELARYLVGTGQVKADISVIPMDGYKRAMWWNETGLQWVNPSPNIRSPDAALLYTGTCYFEGTNLTEGRGTQYPFQMIGASWLTDAGAIAAALNARRVPGVVFDSTTQQVDSGYKFGGQKIPVILMVVSDRDVVKPQQVALILMREIYKRHTADFKWRVEHMDRLFGSPRLRAAIEKEGGVEELLQVMERESAAFAEKTKPYWLYQ